jgi:multimeric flavodoxin WrbA
MAQVARGLEAEDVATRIVVLGEVDITYCLGCRTCESTGVCVHDDDMRWIIDEIKSSEVIALGSPSYWGDVTGQTKVLFDRSLALCDTRTGQTSVPAGKVGVSLAVRAGIQPAENRHLIETMEHYFHHLHIRPVGSLSVESINSPDDIREKAEFLREAYELGRTAALSCLNRGPGQAPPAPGQDDLSG